MTKDQTFHIRSSQFPKAPDQRRGKDWTLIAQQSGRPILPIGQNFLSNFAPSTIEVDDIKFPTAQHAYLASRTNDIKQKMRISSIKSPFRAKIVANRLSTRADWRDDERTILEMVMRLKFSNTMLRQKLAATQDTLILLLNDWGDNIDGVCLDPESDHWWGENRVGMILMTIREEAKLEVEHARWEQEKIQADAHGRRLHYAPSVEVREKLVPIILSLIRLPKKDQKRETDVPRQFPVDLLKFAPWQRVGLHTAEDVMNPKSPDAIYAHTLLRAILRIHDDYEFARAHQRGRMVRKSELEDDPTWRNAPLMTRQRARAMFESLVLQILQEQRVSEIDIQRFRHTVQGLTNSQWRTLFYSADIYMRAGAYEYVRRTAMPTRSWHELDATIDGEDVRSIADVVFDQFYSDGLRVFHGYKDKDIYLAAPTRHDLETHIVRGFMREEVSKIINREHDALNRKQSSKVGREDWRMIRPYDADELWAFDAKSTDSEKWGGDDETDSSGK